MTNSSFVSGQSDKLVASAERELVSFLRKRQQAAHKLDPHYGELLSEIITLIGRGGKRLRPRLVLLAYYGTGGTNKLAIRRAAASQELLHAYLLMHDDVIDRDLTRWGGPNIIGHYNDRFKTLLKATDGRHFAESWSLLAGDASAALSQELLLTSGFAAEKLTQASQLVQTTLFEVIGGELLDSAVTIFNDQPLSMDRLLNIAYYKTATYSFITPLQLGALFANADADNLRHIKTFGKHLGIAYQLTDDLLGMFGDQAALGKPTISDLREGKQTVLIAFTLASASVQQKRLLQKYLHNSAVTDEDLAVVQEIMIECGVQAKTKALIQYHTSRALAMLPKINFSQAAQTELTTLATKLLSRHS